VRVEVQRWSRRRDAEMQRWSRCRQCSVATSTSAGVEVQRCAEVKVQSRYRNGGERWCKCRCRWSGAEMKRCRGAEMLGGSIQGAEESEEEKASDSDSEVVVVRMKAVLRASIAILLTWN
jgi:hypothetical protein